MTTSSSPWHHQALPWHHKASPWHHQASPWHHQRTPWHHQGSCSHLITEVHSRSPAGCLSVQGCVGSNKMTHVSYVDPHLKGRSHLGQTCSSLLRFYSPSRSLHSASDILCSYVRQDPGGEILWIVRTCDLELSSSLCQACVFTLFSSAYWSVIFFLLILSTHRH